MFLLIIVSFLLVAPHHIFAFDPQTINKFGVHLADTNNLDLAANLVNSSGGDWGWVTVVIRKDELNERQWQDFFNQARRLHLIPILRLATESKEGVWQRPIQEEITQMAEFLHELNWPTKEKLIIVFNEPNHGKEWGGEVDPKHYAETFIFTWQTFKKLDEDFCLLFPGPDQVAPQKPPDYFSPQEFYRQVFLYKPEIFEKMDGLASHSYPNRGFVGKPEDRGWGTIGGYKQELAFLKNLGLKKELPVFITESGWPHQEGEIWQKNFYPESKLSKLFNQAFKIWSDDGKIYSFTPFILYFPGGTFSNFSWLDKDKNPYSFYQNTINLPKRSWWPEQLNGAEVVRVSLPLIVLENREYQALLRIKNNGQQIWGEKGNFCWRPEISNAVESSPLCLAEKKTIEPKDVGLFQATFRLVSKPNADSRNEVVIAWKDLEKIVIKPIFTEEGVSLFKTITASWYNLAQRLEKLFKKPL